MSNKGWIVSALWSNKQKPPAPKNGTDVKNVFHSFGGNISHISMYLTYSAKADFTVTDSPGFSPDSACRKSGGNTFI